MTDKKNKPRPVPHHALCDVMMAAYSQNVLQSKEDARKRLAIAEAALCAQGHAMLKQRKRGREMLAMLPDGRATVERNWTKGDYEYSIQLKDGEDELHLPLNAKQLRVFASKRQAIKDLEQAIHRGRYRPNIRRAYVVDTVLADEEAMTKIRKIIDDVIRKPVNATAARTAR